jgi:hypothetical protein
MLTLYPGNAKRCTTERGPARRPGRCEGMQQMTRRLPMDHNGREAPVVKKGGHGRRPCRGLDRGWIRRRSHRPHDNAEGEPDT